MTTSFPGGLDNFTNPQSSDTLDNPNHADQHANVNDAVEALEAKVGANSSAVTTSHDYKIAQLEANAVTDHGALTGLADDDHTQYLLADGTRTATQLTVSGDVTVDTNTFHVDVTDDHVGVGTSSPNYKLDVEDSVSAIISVNDSGGTVGASTNSRVIFEAGGSTAGQVGFLNTGSGIMQCLNQNGQVYVATSTASQISFRVNNVTQAYVASDGDFHANRGIAEPFVFAERTTNQTMTRNAYTVITSTTETDANGWWNGSRFQPNIAGTYHISFIGGLSSGSALSGSTNYRWQVFAYKNTTLTLASNVYSYGYPTCGNAGLITLNGSTDYVEIKGYPFAAADRDLNHFKFSAFRVG